MDEMPLGHTGKGFNSADMAVVFILMPTTRRAAAGEDAGLIKNNIGR